ncbi:MAG TPA: zinc-binding dehydrogenase [Acidimicrobiales bacterium]|jgi:NADPH:quinone reductase-like Zn-dependent oxidoreductase|nr:zinc-binding dehydrogenase [Acidimicrobiales bacterium]
MRAAFHEMTGGVEVLRVGEVPDPPDPAPGDVQIRVRAASLDRVDLYCREGSHGMVLRQVPHIGGRDVAGIVNAVGDGVRGVAIGDEVVASGWRTHAQLANARAVLTFPKPVSCSFEEAAAIPTAGRSAAAALLERVSIQAGETVLVTAAGSGVGSFGVQIARAVGCRVIATAGPAKLDQALALGAHVAIDHYRTDLVDAVFAATAGAGVDVVLDHIGTPLWDAVIRVLRPWGRYVTTGVTAGHRVPLHLGQVFVRGLTITGVGRPTDDQIAVTLRNLLAMVDARTVRPVVSEVVPLDQIARAHQLMERSAFFGKIVLAP